MMMMVAVVTTYVMSPADSVSQLILINTEPNLFFATTTNISHCLTVQSQSEELGAVFYEQLI